MDYKKNRCIYAHSLINTIQSNFSKLGNMNIQIKAQCEQL